MTPFITIASLGMVSFGMVLTMLGASLPVIIERFGIDTIAAGGLLALLSLGVVAGSVSFGPIVDRRGYKGMLVLSFACIAIGLEVVAFAPSLAVLRLALIVIGYTGGLLNGAANALVADVATGNRSAALTFVGAFFGVGAAGVPLLLAMFSTTLPFASILAGCGAFVIIPLVVTWRSPFPESKQPHGFPVAEARRLLHNPLLLLISAMMFIESGIESTAGGWTPTLFVRDLGVSIQRAPLYLSIFWFGLLLGRLILSAVLRATRPSQVLLTSLCVALVASLIVVLTRGTTLAALGVFLLGAGFASTFPILYGVVGERFTSLSGTALGIGMAIALTGGTLLPYFTGAVAMRYGLRAAFYAVPVGVVVLAVLVATSRQRLWPASRTAT
ncbi:MAG TPA: MFS transporter [Gemmatimonadaceae bacterium]|nr:MFS transporter [Gemmatimonadaceae bacterium]